MKVTVLPLKRGMQIRLENEYGFRWFYSKNKRDKEEKIKKAIKIQKDIEQRGWSSPYAGKQIQL
jgi:hypothetical protein